MSNSVRSYSSIDSFPVTIIHNSYESSQEVTHAAIISVEISEIQIILIRFQNFKNSELYVANRDKISCMKFFVYILIRKIFIADTFLFNFFIFVAP